MEIETKSKLIETKEIVTCTEISLSTDEVKAILMEHLKGLGYEVDIVGLITRPFYRRDEWGMNQGLTSEFIKAVATVK